MGVTTETEGGAVGGLCWESSKSGAHKNRVVSVDLSDKAVWYRIRSLPFSFSLSFGFYEYQ